MHLRAPSPEVQHRDSAYRLRRVGRARERHSRDSERSPNVETGAVSVGRPQALVDAKRGAEFEAEISLFEDHNADIPGLTQITQLFRWRNQAITRFDPGALSIIAIYRQLFFVLPGGGPGLSLPSQRMKAQNTDEIHKGLK
jgi:hypothetical protein